MSNLKIEDHDEWIAAIEGITTMVPIAEKPTTKRVFKKPVRDMIFTHDLHGRTLDEAFKYVRDLLPEASLYNIDTIRVITGKSGAIYREFHSWMLTPYFSQYVNTVVLEPGGGSYLLTLH